jgi:hypothetical protein
MGVLWAVIPCIVSVVYCFSHTCSRVTNTPKKQCTVGGLVVGYMNLVQAGAHFWHRMLQDASVLCVVGVSAAAVCDCGKHVGQCQVNLGAEALGLAPRT